jgi:hypothetical protein
VLFIAKSPNVYRVLGVANWQLSKSSSKLPGLVGIISWVPVISSGRASAAPGHQGKQSGGVVGYFSDFDLANFRIIFSFFQIRPIKVTKVPHHPTTFSFSVQSELGFHLRSELRWRGLDGTRRWISLMACDTAVTKRYTFH